MFKTHISCLKNAGCNQQSSSAKHPAEPASHPARYLQPSSTAKCPAEPTSAQTIQLELQQRISSNTAQQSFQKACQSSSKASSSVSYRSTVIGFKLFLELFLGIAIQRSSTTMSSFFYRYLSSTGTSIIVCPFFENLTLHPS